MTIDVFSKNVTSKTGKKFKVYSGHLNTIDGDIVYVKVHFVKDAYNQIKDMTFPKTIEFNKKDANVAKRAYIFTDNTGEKRDAIEYNLYINKIDTINDYIDHSLDMFE